MKKEKTEEKKIKIKKELSEKQISRRFNIVAILCIIIFCFAIAPISLQNDTFYTIKIGQDVMQNGINMEHDRYTWHDLPYTFPHWAYDVFIGFIFNCFGYWGIYFSTILLACILGITLYLTQSKLSKNKLTSFLITIGAIYLLRNFIAARAQLVTFILFTLTIYCIEMFLRTKKKRYAISLVIIPILIANIHLAVWPFYFILFLPYVVEYIIAWIRKSSLAYDVDIKRFKKKIKKLTENLDQKPDNKEKIIKLEKKIEKLEQDKEKRQEGVEKRDKNPYRLVIHKNDAGKWLIVIMLICILTGLLTPLQGTPYTYLIKTMEGNTTQNISEHLPLTLINSKDIMCYIIILLAILIFTDTKIKLRDFFMIGGLLLLTFMSRRQMSMFVLIGSFVLNNLICSLFDKYDPEGTNKFIKHMTSKLGIALTVGIVVLASLGIFIPKRNSKFISKSSYPVDAVEYIKKNVDLTTMKIFNEYNNGSYLLLHDIPVFIDSRADLYTPEFNKGKDIFSDFINISNINIYYEDKFEEYGITHVLIGKKSKLNLLLSRDDKYKELYSDDDFVFYEREK